MAEIEKDQTASVVGVAKPLVREGWGHDRGVETGGGDLSKDAAPIKAQPFLNAWREPEVITNPTRPLRLGSQLGGFLDGGGAGPGGFLDQDVFARLDRRSGIPLALLIVALDDDEIGVFLLECVLRRRADRGAELAGDGLGEGLVLVANPGECGFVELGDGVEPPPTMGVRKPQEPHLQRFHGGGGPVVRECWTRVSAWLPLRMARWARARDTS